MALKRQSYDVLAFHSFMKFDKHRHVPEWLKIDGKSQGFSGVLLRLDPATIASTA